MAISFNPLDILSGFNLTKLNQNFQNIKTALSDGLSRSGGSPNQMNADIDMNSNDLLNVKNIDAETFMLNGVEVVPNGTTEIPNTLKTSNALSELPAAGLDDEARDNLGLGTIAVRDTTDFTINVVEYSPDRTGVASVTTAFQNAYNAALEGQNILVPVGTYKFVGAVSGTKNVNWVIDGTLNNPGNNWADFLPGNVLLIGKRSYTAGIPQSVVQRIDADGMSLSTADSVDYFVLDIADNVQSSAGRVQGLVVYDRIKTGVTGIRQTLAGQAIIEGVPGVTPGGGHFVGVQASGNAFANSLGTDALFGLNSFAEIQPGITGWNNITAGEFNTTIGVGGAANIRSGIQIAGGGPVAGTTKDAAIIISNLTGSVGWGNGLLFDSTNGNVPLGAGSTAIRVDSGTINHFANLVGTTINGSYLLTNDANWKPASLELLATNQQILLGNRTVVNSPTFFWFSSGNTNPDANIQVTGGTGATDGTMAINCDTIVPSGDARPAANETKSIGNATFKWLEGYFKRLFFGSNGAYMTSHTATPEGAITAPIGSLCTDTTGGKLYVKATGTGNTGWVVAGTQT